MLILWILFIISIFSITTFYNRKGIKAIKIVKIDLIYITALVFFLLYFIIFHLVPINSYYIKEENYSSAEFSSPSLMTDRIIEDEMDINDISYDEGSLRIMGAFEGKTKLIFMTQYTNQGKKEVKIFEFDRNIFGNLKPSIDFKDLKTIEESEEDSIYGSVINDGLAQFLVNFGFQNYNPDIVGLSPEGYFFYSERIDRWKLTDFLLIGLMFLIILYSKKEKTYTKVIMSTKKIDIIEIEYLIKDKFKH